MKISDILSDNSTPKVHNNSSINEVIIEISQKRLGAVAVLSNDRLEGIITDGDLRRMLEKESSLDSLVAKDIMSVNPKTIDADSLAYDALEVMERNNISQMVVLSKSMYVGIIHIHDILKEGVL